MRQRNYRNNDNFKNDQFYSSDDEHVDPEEDDQDFFYKDFSVSSPKVSNEQTLQKFRDSVTNTINNFLEDPDYAFGKNCSKNNAPYVIEIRGDPSNGSYTVIIDGLDTIDVKSFQTDVKKGLGNEYSFQQLTSTVPIHMAGVSTYSKNISNVIRWNKTNKTIAFFRWCFATCLIWTIIFFLSLDIWLKHDPILDYFEHHETPFWHIYGALLLQISVWIGIN